MSLKQEIKIYKQISNIDLLQTRYKLIQNSSLFSIVPKSKRTQSYAVDCIRSIKLRQDSKQRSNRPRDIIQAIRAFSFEEKPTVGVVASDTLLSRSLELNPESGEIYIPGLQIIGSMDEILKKLYDKNESCQFTPFSIALGIPRNDVKVWSSNQIEYLKGKIVITNDTIIANRFINSLFRDKPDQPKPTIITIPYGARLTTFVEESLRSDPNTVFLLQKAGGTEMQTLNMLAIFGYQSPCIDIVESGNSMKDAGLTHVVRSPQQTNVLIANSI